MLPFQAALPSNRAPVFTPDAQSADADCIRAAAGHNGQDGDQDTGFILFGDRPAKPGSFQSQPWPGPANPSAHRTSAVLRHANEASTDWASIFGTIKALAQKGPYPAIFPLMAQQANVAPKPSVVIMEITDEAPATATTPHVRPAGPAVPLASHLAVSPPAAIPSLAVAAPAAMPPAAAAAASIPAAAAPILTLAAAPADQTPGLRPSGCLCLSPAGLERLPEADADNIVQELVQSLGPDSPDEV